MTRGLREGNCERSCRDRVSGVLVKIRETQMENIEKASAAMAEAIANDGLVHLLGSEHSVLPVMESRQMVEAGGSFAAKNCSVPYRIDEETANILYSRSWTRTEVGERVHVCCFATVCFTTSTMPFLNLLRLHCIHEKSLEGRTCNCSVACGIHFEHNRPAFGLAMFLEDVGRLVLWLILLVMSLNLVFFFFLLRRRLIRKRFFTQKDAAREHYRDPVDAFALGQIGLKQAAAVLGDARSPAAREVVSEMLFAATSADNTERISELLFLLGFVEEWVTTAFGRKASKKLTRVLLDGEVKTPEVRWPKLLRPIYRMRLTAVPRALAVNNLGRLSPRHAHNFLRAALEDPSSQVRRVAVEGMGHNRNPEAIPLLVDELRKALEEGNDLSLRTLKAALIRYRLEDLDLFLPCLASASRRCRFFAIDSMRRIGDRAAVHARLTKNDFSLALYRAVLEQCQFDEFEDVRARSSYVAKYFRDSGAVGMLRRLIQDPNEFVRMHALRAAADRSYADLIPEVVARLTDERWLVREAAVQALQAMGARGTHAMFRFVTDCTDQFAAEQACDEFQRQGIVPQLLAAIAAGGDERLLAEKVTRKMASLGKTSLLLSHFTSSDSLALQISLIDTLAVNPTGEFVSRLNVLCQQDSGQISSKAREVLDRIRFNDNARFGSSSARSTGGKEDISSV